MFGNMFNKKNTDEYNEYEDEGNFSYNEDLKTNEFNDATIEYGDGEEIEEEIYEEDPHEFNKNKIMFYALIAGLIILLLIVLLIRGCVLTDGKLKSIELTAPDIIYVGEKEKITVRARGSRNLKNTVYKFDTSNNSIVEVEAKGYVKGKTATDYLIPITTGRFILQASAQLDDVKLPNVEKEIVICRRLSEEAFHSNELTAVINKPIKLNVDLGDDTECFSDLTYNIKDTSIVNIDNSGNLIGLKKGSTTITFKSDGKEITKTINVALDGKSVTGLSLNKTNVTLTVGQTETIKATITPSDAANKNINWTSSNSGVVTVSKTGKLTGVGKGTAIVKATTEDGGRTKLINVTVKNKSIGGNQGGGTTSKDTTAPKINSVKIYSNNTYSEYAKEKDKVTLEMTFSETLGTKPVVTIGGKSVSVTCSGTTCKAVYTVIKDSPEGNLSFVISSYKDKVGNTGNVVTTTNGSKVTIDKIQPVCTAIGNRTTTKENVKFTWYDNNSGVREVIKPNGTKEVASVVEQKVDGNETFSYDIESTDYSVSMTITDWAGNTKKCSHPIQKNGSTQKTYTATFTFDTNTGVSNIGATSLSCTTTGTNKSCPITAPKIIAQSGYTVVGWSTSKTATKEEYKVGISIDMDSNKTLYAIVSKNSSVGGGGGNTSCTPGEITDSGCNCSLKRYQVKCNSKGNGYVVEEFTTSCSAPTISCSNLN